MRFLDWLEQGSKAHKASREDGELRVCAVSTNFAAVMAFQPIVERIRKHEGDGYTIIAEHLSSSSGALDVILIRVLS